MLRCFQGFIVPSEPAIDRPRRHRLSFSSSSVATLVCFLPFTPHRRRRYLASTLPSSFRLALTRAMSASTPLAHPPNLLQTNARLDLLPAELLKVIVEQVDAQDAKIELLPYIHSRWLINGDFPRGIAVLSLTCRRLREATLPYLCQVRHQCTTSRTVRLTRVIHRKFAPANLPTRFSSSNSYRALSFRTSGPSTAPR